MCNTRRNVIEFDVILAWKNAEMVVCGTKMSASKEKSVHFTLFFFMALFKTIN